MEAGAGNHGMARQLFKCAVKADPKSEPSWLVSMSMSMQRERVCVRVCKCVAGWGG